MPSTLEVGTLSVRVQHGPNQGRSRESTPPQTRPFHFTNALIPEGPKEAQTPSACHAPSSHTQSMIEGSGHASKRPTVLTVRYDRPLSRDRETLAISSYLFLLHAPRTELAGRRLKRSGNGPLSRTLDLPAKQHRYALDFNGSLACWAEQTCRIYYPSSDFASCCRGT